MTSPRPFAEALQELVGSTVARTDESRDSAGLLFHCGTIVANLNSAELAGEEAIHLVERTLVSESWDFVRDEND